MLKRDGDTVIAIDPFMLSGVFLGAILSCAEKLEKRIHDSHRGRKPKVVEVSDQFKEIKKIVEILQRHIEEDSRNINESLTLKSPEQ